LLFKLKELGIESKCIGALHYGADKLVDLLRDPVEFGLKSPSLSSDRTALTIDTLWPPDRGTVIRISDHPSIAHNTTMLNSGMAGVPIIR
jgi:hypothetical protein